ncbi:MAG: lysophospholipid acyltransferase family protein [Pseudomonadota bacterium]
MVDIEYLKRINLVSEPLGQKLIGHLFLGPNFKIFSKVDIRIENEKRIPHGENVIFAMNHTDRFNYWPFQYKMWRMKDLPWTTVWVKGKYYRNSLLAKGLDWCNLIPVPSMGYLIEEFFVKKARRRIGKDEYRIVRDVVDGKYDAIESVPVSAKETVRLLGDNFIEYIRDYYESVMERVAALSCHALLEKKLNIIIFPEGTRSTQLGEGRTGMAQLALHTGVKVVPVGCNNSEQIYPGSSPVAKSGRIVYRVGEPMCIDDQLKEFRIPEKFKLLSKESQLKYKDQFEGATRLIMLSISELLDEKYRRAFNEA